MQSGLYRIRVADGSEYGPATEADVCGWITQGRINRDAFASMTQGQYVPILQVAAFARAFEMQSNLQPAAAPAQAQAVSSAPAAAGQAAAVSQPVAESQSVEGFLFGDQNLNTGDIFPGGGGQAPSSHPAQPGSPTASAAALATQQRAATAAPGTPLPGATPGYASSPGIAVGGSPMPQAVPQVAQPGLTPMPMQVNQVNGAGQPVLGLQPQATEAGNGEVVEAENQAVAAYLQERKDFESACKDLQEGRFVGAKEKFDALAEARPKTSEYLSSAAYADLMLAADDKERFAAAGTLREIHEQYAYCVPTLLYLARASLKIDRPKAAVRYLKSALEIEPDRRDLQRELQRAQEASDGRTGTQSQDKLSTLASFKSSLAERGGHDDTSSDEEINPKQLVSSLAVFLGVFGVLYSMGVITAMGEKEYYYESADQFWWLRRVLLLAVGGIMAFVALKDERLDKSDFLPVPNFMVVAVVWGIAAGFMSPWQNVKSPMWIVLLMTVFHVFAEEVFFRVYLARNLARSLGGLVAPTALGALLYGLYHLSYFEVTANSSAVVGWSWVGMIALGAGIPYNLLYYYSRSLTVPFVCHLLVNGTMMLLSYEHIQP